MCRLILSDLDHTLLRSDGSISDHTLDVLRRCSEQGILFAIATARYWIGAERYIDLLNPDYEITTDGTLIHSNGKCIYSCEFTVEETNKIVQAMLERKPDAEITVADGKTVYWNSKHIAESERLHKATYCEYDKPLKCRANKIVAELQDETIAIEITDKIDCKLQSYRGEKWYTFIPKGSGKIEAIKSMAEMCGISIDDIIAFGDDNNDIDMLKICGTGIAVSNAIKEVLDIADEVTASNDEDGVACWIEKNLLDHANEKLFVAK